MDPWEMADTWTIDDFNDPCDARDFAECVAASGGKVVSISYGSVHPMAQQIHKWLVFATFAELAQEIDAAERWSKRKAPISGR